MEHSVGINPVEELKPRATAGDPASEEAAEAVAAVAAAAVVAVVDDDASWRFEHEGAIESD